MSLPFNLGNSKEIKILDLAYLIIKLSKSKSKIKFMPLPKDDPQRRLPDVTKAKKLLNWSPKIQLEDGLKETIRWFKKNL
jgi:UDP-glucuronate decarboxylase